MTQLFLHFWNVATTFRIWSSDIKNPYLKYVSSHFLTLAIEFHLAQFRLGASFTCELHCSLPSTPLLLLLFPSHKKICYFASSGLTKEQKVGFHTLFTLFPRRLNSSSSLQLSLLSTRIRLSQGLPDA